MSGEAQQDYDRWSYNAMFARLETQIATMDDKLTKVLAWQASFGIRTEKEIGELRTRAIYSRGKLAGAVIILTLISGFLAWLGVLAVTLATGFWKP